MTGAQLSFFELSASDLDAAKAFYSRLLGWSFRATASPDFIMIEGAGTPGGIIRDPSATGGRPKPSCFSASLT